MAISGLVFLQFLQLETLQLSVQTHMYVAVSFLGLNFHDITLFVISVLLSLLNHLLFPGTTAPVQYYCSPKIKFE